MCMFARSHLLLRRYVLLVLPAFVLGLVPAITVAPDAYYADGYLAALLLMLLLALGYGISALGSLRAELFDTRLSRRGRWALVAAGGAAALLLASAIASPGMRARAEAWAASGTHAAP
jgi:hypothetical protein